MNNINRRQFLIGAATAGLATVAGVGVLVTHQPAITFAEHACGRATAAPGSVLVAYASRYGSTGEVATAIAAALCRTGWAAEARQLTTVTDLAPYQAIIVGAPVISDEWMPAASEFVATHHDELRTRPVAYFLTCMSLALDDGPETRAHMAAVLAQVQRQVPAVQPVATGLFAGALDYAKMSYALQGLYRVFADDVTSGDFRDWAAIQRWAHTTEPRLAPTG